MKDAQVRQRHRYPALFIEFPKAAIDRSITDLFEQQVRQWPENLAVKFRDQGVTYNELNRMANRLAWTLPRFDRPRPMPVALFVEQGITLIASILAVLKAGHSYAPLDHRQPRTLLAKTLEDLQPGAILADSRNLHLAAAIADVSCPVINAEAVEAELSDDNLNLSTSPDTAACLFYTSGSTGEPKGVIDIHRNVLHNVMRYTNTLGFSPADRMSLVQHGSFSGTVSTLFGALLNGAAVFPLDLEVDGLAAIAAWAQRERITIFHSVPSIFRQFAADYQPYAELRLIRLEGDSVTARDIKIFQKTFAESCILVNGLGATECGLVRQYFIDKGTELSGQTVPVGYPVEGLEVHVVDESGNDVPANDIGEIVVKSPYLALGYWRKPELTAAKFKSVAPGLYAYQTGDLGTMSRDGCLKHLGRKDYQTKIGGNNVDTADVEHAVLRIKAVAEALVQTYTDGVGEQHLVAYLVAQDGAKPTVSDIRECLEPMLPRHMIPTAYVFLERLPLTQDGKVDRLKLPAPPPVTRPFVRTQYVAPETPMERKLAGIWAEALKLDLQHIGVMDSFFDLGGESMRANQVVARLARSFGIEISVVAMFEHPTIRSLIGYLVGSRELETDRLARTSERAAKQRAALARLTRTD